MAFSIIRTDQRGTYRMVAECDLYLDETMAKVIVVGEGEDVPKEAAFVLAGKGGTIPARYMKLVEGLDAKVDKTKPEAEVPELPEPLPEVPAEPVVEVEVKPEAEPMPEPKPAKSKKLEKQ